MCVCLCNGLHSSTNTMRNSDNYSPTFVAIVTLSKEPCRVSVQECLYPSLCACKRGGGRGGRGGGGAGRRGRGGGRGCLVLQMVLLLYKVMQYACRSAQKYVWHFSRQF